MTVLACTGLLPSPASLSPDPQPQTQTLHPQHMKNFNASFDISQHTMADICSQNTVREDVFMTYLSHVGETQQK